MFSIFKKKKIIPLIRLSGVIGNVGKFRQGIDLSGYEEIIKKAFSIKKSPAAAISINSPGGSPVQSHLVHDFIRYNAKKNNKKVIIFAEDLAGNLTEIQIVTLTFDREAPKTVPNIPGGIYNQTKQIKLTTNEQARTYYSLDGTTPTESSNR